MPDETEFPTPSQRRMLDAAPGPSERVELPADSEPAATAVHSNSQDAKVAENVFAADRAEAEAERLRRLTEQRPSMRSSVHLGRGPFSGRHPPGEHPGTIGGPAIPNPPPPVNAAAFNAANPAGRDRHVYEGMPDGRQARPGEHVTTSRFRPRYRNLTPFEVSVHDQLKMTAEVLERTINAAAVAGGDQERLRYKALAITHLEISIMFAVKALTL